ncbi:MAG: glycosyltransferase [Kiritimatiellaceae bacterium]|nr:glycosyltransferase [Kiritimatiellaceae bacterium]
MKFSIITPALNQLPYLKRCIASVADQQGVEVEHIVIDGGSTDGTVEWLNTVADRYRLTFISEPDKGMYDALNKGVTLALQKQGDENLPDNWQQTTGNCDDEIVAWLNCDEQYLPGTLEKVAQYFTEHPDADAAYGDVLLVSPDGGLLTCRKNPPLRRAYILADHLYAHSASMFFRSGIFDSGLRFDSSWKAVSDCDFILRVLKSGFRFGQIKKYLSACTMSGENLSRQQAGIEELKAFRRLSPPLYRMGRPAWNAFRYLEKFLRGGYAQALPLEYELYTEDLDRRRLIRARAASCKFRWDGNE